MARKPWHHATESRHKRGYGKAWGRLRAVVLRLVDGRPSALCAVCLKAGRPTPATQCDHIIPKAQGGRDDLRNLQPLCDACHTIKTEAEALRGRNIAPRPGFTPDGRPVWDA